MTRRRGLWETATGKSLLAPLQHQDRIVAVAFSPDGKTVVTGSSDKTARLWQTATGKPLVPALQHQDIIVTVAFSPDGKTVLTGSYDKTARLWEAGHGQAARTSLAASRRGCEGGFQPGRQDRADGEP